MSSPKRLKRLKYELEEMHKLRRESTMFDFAAEGDPPERYLAYFKVRSFKDIQQVNNDWKPIYSDEHIAEIYLNANFPVEPPEVKIMTPIFHPNIASRQQNTYSIREMNERLDAMTNQAEKEAAIKWWNEEPSLKVAHICLDILKTNWSMSYTVREVCIEIAAMLQFKPRRYRPDDAYNNRAGAWVLQYPMYVPSDTRDFIDRPEPDIEDFEIQVIDISSL